MKVRFNTFTDTLVQRRHAARWLPGTLRSQHRQFQTEESQNEVKYDWKRIEGTSKDGFLVPDQSSFVDIQTETLFRKGTLFHLNTLKVSRAKIKIVLIAHNFQFQVQNNFLSAQNLNCYVQNKNHCIILLQNNIRFLSLCNTLRVAYKADMKRHDSVLCIRIS